MGGSDALKLLQDALEALTRGSEETHRRLWRPLRETLEGIVRGSRLQSLIEDSGVSVDVSEGPRGRLWKHS